MRTLAARLMASYLILIAVCLGVLVWRVGTLVDTMRYTSTLRDQEGRAILVASAIDDALLAYQNGEKDLATLAAETDLLDSQVSQLMVILDQNGNVLVDPEHVNEPHDQSSLPEISRALAGEVSNQIRFDADDNDDTVFTAAPIRHNKDIIGVARIELPMSAVRESSRRTWLIMVAGALLAGAATILVSLLLARTVVNPIRQIEQAAKALADGDLERRLNVGGPTELAELARSFNSMAARIASVRNNQRAFVANAAHELRTPLTTIRLRAEALHGGVEAETSERFLSDIESETERLSRLVNELLDLSRIETGLVEPRRERVALAPIAQSVSRTLSALAAEKEIAVEISAPADLPFVLGDPDQLHRVLINLLDNALKFTPNGGRVEVNLHAVRNEVWVQIRDSGPGIPVADLPQIFNRFYRSDKARARETGGAGLGLAIVKSIVQAHGGRVWAESPVGQGATIAFALPIRPPAKPNLRLNKDLS